jgi:hypothetical protein
MVGEGGLGSGVRDLPDVAGCGATLPPGGGGGLWFGVATFIVICRFPCSYSWHQQLLLYTAVKK